MWRGRAPRSGSRFTDVESDQARLSLTVVGFATAFELVVLAWSSARRGISDAVVAAVIGSYAYNATMTLGAAAVITHSGSRTPRCCASPCWE